MPVPLPAHANEQWLLVNVDKEQFYGSAMELRQLYFSCVPACLAEHLRTSVEAVPDTISIPSDTDEESMAITDAMLDALLTPPIPAPWCGGRIICLGNRLEPCDLPPSLDLSLPERAKIRRAVNKLHDLPAMVGHPKTLYSVASRTFKHAPVTNLAYYENDIPRFSSCAAEFFLRNHSLMEFVSGRAVALRGKSRNRPLTLGHALLARTCWSSAPSRDMQGQNTQTMHRGAWAGDRFDVVRSDDWPVRERGEWTDVSVEVMEEVLGAFDYLSSLSGEREGVTN